MEAQPAYAGIISSVRVTEEGGRLVSSATVSLTDGWGKVPGSAPPCPGDLVVIEVCAPRWGVEAPPGWGVAPGGRFYSRWIGAEDDDPVFRTAAEEGREVLWYVEGLAFPPPARCPCADAGES